MAVNRYAPHVLVIPEDDANRNLANGFGLHAALNSTRIQVLPPLGGWPKVLDDFEVQQGFHLRKFPQRHLVLLIDFDGQFKTCLGHFQNRVPEDVRERGYVVGTADEPEALRADHGMSLERIGEELAEACAAQEIGLWGHDMLKHNRKELERLVKYVKPFLFS